MRYALLVGIDKYSYAPWNLFGCKNDVMDMYKLLADVYKFPLDNIRVVVDERATKEGILSRLEWLVSSMSEGSVGVFYYSGHGTRIRDRDGDESLLDYMDECLVPHDAYPDNFLIDDEIADVLSKLNPAASLYVIFDCCYSGTATRSPVLASSAFVELSEEVDISDYAIRYIEPPVDIALRSYGRFLPVKKLWNYIVNLVSGDNEKSVDVDSSLKHCYMSASSDDEVSLEVVINNKRRGVFTYNLCSILRSNSGMNIRMLHDEVKRKISMSGFKQTPQLESAPKFLDRPIFSPVV